MANEPFNFDPDDLDRLFPGAGDQLRGALGQLGRMLNGAGQFDGSARRTRPAPEPPTTGETGDGVWVIYTVNGDGGARVEQIFATELDALRANKHNTDSDRRVRFVPYGITLSVLDETEAASDDNS